MKLHKFLLILLLLTAKASLGSTLLVKVYWDKNLNGYFDSEDIALPEFPVSIYNATNGSYITTLYTDNNGNIQYNANGTIYVVANEGIYSYKSLWNKATLIGVAVKNGNAFCLGNTYKNYQGFCAGGYNPSQSDIQYINKTSFDKNLNNYFVEVNATQNTKVAFGFSPFAVVNSKIDFNSEGSFCSAFKQAVDYLENNNEDSQIFIEFFSGNLPFDRWYYLNYINNCLQYKSSFQNDRTVKVIIDGEVRNSLSGKEAEVMNPVKSVGFKEIYLLPELPYGEPLEGGYFVSPGENIHIGTGKDALPSYVADYWEENLYYKKSPLEKDEPLLSPVKAPNLVLNEWNQVNVDTDSNVIVIFKNVSIPRGIIFNSPGYVEDSFINLTPDRDVYKTSAGITVNFNPYSVNSDLTFKHNLIVAKDYGIYICPNKKVQLFNNKLDISENYIGYIDNGYGIYLCDSVSEPEFKLPSVLKNIYIERNLIYNVYGGIYVGQGNSDILITDNTIYVTDRTIRSPQDFKRRSEDFLTRLDSTVIKHIGINLAGSNKHIIIALNYLHLGDSGVNLIGNVAALCGQLALTNSGGIVVFRNFFSYFQTSSSLVGFFTPYEKYGVLYKENIVYNNLIGFLLNPFQYLNLYTSITFDNNLLVKTTNIYNNMRFAAVKLTYICPYVDFSAPQKLTLQLNKTQSYPEINSPQFIENKTQESYKNFSAPQELIFSQNKTVNYSNIISKQDILQFIKHTTYWEQINFFGNLTIYHYKDYKPINALGNFTTALAYYKSEEDIKAITEFLKKLLLYVSDPEIKAQLELFIEQILAYANIEGPKEILQGNFTYPIITANKEFIKSLQEYLAKENIKAKDKNILNILIKFIEYQSVKAPKKLKEALAVIKTYPTFETATVIHKEEISIIEFAQKIRMENPEKILQHLQEYIPNKELLENFFEELNLRPKTVKKIRRILFWLELF